LARLTDFLRGFFARGDFVKINSAAYEAATSELYYKELAIRQAVSIITNIVSKCEIKVYYDGEVDDTSKEYYAWNIAPNDNQNGAELLAKIVEELLLCNHALVFEAGKGRYCADDFNIEKDGTKPYIFTGVSVDGGSFSKQFKRKDVLYFKLGNAELTRLIDNVYASYGEVMAFTINNYKQRSGSKWKLKISAAAKARADFKQTYADITQKSLKTFFEATNAVYPEFEGYELTQYPVTMSDTKSADITALRQDIVNMVASVYKLPLSVMNGTAVSDADMKQLQTQCIEPIVSVIAKELTKQMFTFEQWKKGCRFEVDTTNIEHLDISSLAGAAEKLIGSGLMNIDEVRVRILGLNALNTEQSTKYWITKNFADIETMSNSDGTGGGAEIETDLSA
jgi:HK97 family phage portal protein